MDKLPKELVKRLREVNAIIAKLDPAIRSSAFAMFQSYLAGTTEPKGPGTRKPDQTADQEPGDAASFFTKHEIKTPYDSAMAIATFLYSQYGSHPFTSKQIGEMAVDVGLTVPARLDMTFLSAKQKGKSLFARAGRKRFKPTVHGEEHMKKSFGVKKGSKKPPDEPQQ